MFGNVINNKKISELIERKIIEISPFDPDKLDTVHYPLSADAAFEIQGRNKNGRSKLSPTHNRDSAEMFELEPQQYVLVRVAESVVLPKGIVALFASPFHLVENGFSLSAGRLEAPFGKKGERLVFGLKNELNETNTFSYKDTIAYIYFIDLTGLDNIDAIWTPEELRKFSLWSRRYAVAHDDGVSYGDGS